MARRYAPIWVRIWSDEDFKQLHPLQQHMFFVLISQPRMNLCGVIDYIPKRIANCSYDMSVEDVELHVKALEKERYVVVDRDTQELLVRTFVRNDEILKIPNVAQGMSADYGEVMSTTLAAAIDKELIRAFKEDSTLAGWKGVKKGNPVLFRRVTGIVD